MIVGKFRYIFRRIDYLCNLNRNSMGKKDINRLKVVLVEKKRTGRWLAEQLGKDPATVSKWCTNSSQPGLETLLDIARCLEVDVKELLCVEK
jgi:transcriptional regulator with XRE-family HTH domain